MYVKRLRKIKEFILAHPSLYDQDKYCGVAGCIAGHAVVQFGKLPKNLKLIGPECADVVVAEHFRTLGGTRIADTATSLLGLTVEQARRLFGAFYWPSRFARRYYAAKTPRTRARVCADRIDAFIKSKGKE